MEEKRRINWVLEEFEIKNLLEYNKNPRQISKEQFHHLANLIDTFGLIDKPIINRDMKIIGGHQRIRVLKKMKKKKVECWIPDVYLTPEEIEHLCIGLNLNQGKFDYEILADLWEPLDLLKYGFTEEQLLGTYETSKRRKRKKKQTAKKKNVLHVDMNFKGIVWQ